MDKKRSGWVFFLIASAVIVSFSSCVYDREFAYMNDQIVTLDKRVTQLQESIDLRLGSDLSSRLEGVHSGQAESRAEIEQLKMSLADLSGRVEENEHMMKRALERDLSEQDTLQSSLVRLSEKVTELEAGVRRNSEYLGLEPPAGRAQKEAAVLTPAAEDKQPLRTSIEPGQAVSAETSLYDQALAWYREGRYEEAMAGFADLLKQYPQSDRADNAQFWIGESYMAQKQYEQAILAYQKVIKGYPKGNKVPNALLRQAIAFAEINDKTSSQLLLKKIIKNYPDSSEAKIAKIRLEKMK